MTNTLAIIIDDFIKSKGVKKIYIAEQLGMPQQRLNDLFNKKNFTIDDANRILAVIGYKIDYDIKPIWFARYIVI